MVSDRPGALQRLLGCCGRPALGGRGNQRSVGPRGRLVTVLPPVQCSSQVRNGLL